MSEKWALIVWVVFGMATSCAIYATLWAVGAGDSLVVPVVMAWIAALVAVVSLVPGWLGPRRR